MHKIQHKLLLLLILVSIVPLAIIGSYTYCSSVGALKQALEDSSSAIVDQICRNVEDIEKSKENDLEYMANHIVIQQVMRDLDFVQPDEAAYEATEKLNQIFNAVFYKKMDIQSVALFFEKGGHFEFNGYISDENAVRNAEWYRYIGSNNGKITWIGESQDIQKGGLDTKTYIVGRVVRDTSYKGDMKPLGMVLLLLKSDIYRLADQSVNISPQTKLFVTDKNGKRISEGTEEMGNVNQHAFGYRILSGTKDNFNQVIGGKEYVVSFQTSKVTGFKIFQITPYENYIADINRMNLLAGILAALFLVALYVIACVISKRISKPLLQLSKAMMAAEQGNFDVSVSVVSKDEVGSICRGFNSMVGRIKQLFNNLLEQETQKRKAQIRTLQYQINPHFLYNTLITIRMVVGMGRSQDGMQMLLSLSNLLYNTLSKIDRFIDVKDEIENVKEYIQIFQVMYKQRIVLTVEIQEETEHLKVPCMLLQPIVENSIMHGLNSKLNTEGERGELRIFVGICREHLQISVTDNGQGMDTETIDGIFHPEWRRGMKDRGSIGVKNCYDRIKLLFGEQYGLRIESEQGRYTTVCMEIPVVLEEGDYEQVL